MIDPADKKTQSLPLDTSPVKRGRGRPTTGKALTPAEKQKAYRKRQKEREYELGGAAMAGEEAFKELNETCRKLATAEGKILYLERQLEELQEKYEFFRNAAQRIMDKTVNELDEANAEIERIKSNVTGIELTNAEATAIISLLGDKARDISMRSEEPINPRQRESINWLIELSKKIAQEIKR